ncbi:MAG TPA: ABC transporter ATP-binding protein [Pseudonocardia sp.]|nr:ABC transporter ATP-binding protein [Pseudonocardia sp.]
MAEPERDLELVGITKRFGDFAAVDDVSLVMPSGSFFALLGPSGCGKTTMLRMIAGLETPTAGRVLIGGRDVTTTKAHERPVNTVFQSYALFPHLDVAENVAFGLRRRRERDVDARVAAALELVELGAMAGRKPSRLSGGQQQRVALARAVVNNPAVLLLDEPLGALDLKLRRQMQVELKRIQNEVGLTFVHVTHDQEEAMTMADTVAVMNAGRIEQLGPPQELYDLPRTAFVANFLGRSNLVPGTVVDGGSGDGVLGIDAGGVRMQLPASRAAASEGDVLVGIRPEKVRLLTDDATPEPGATVLGPGTVEDVSFCGVSTEYIVRVPGVGPLVVFAQNLAADVPVAPGDEVRLTWSPRHAFALPGDATAPVADLTDGAPRPAVVAR